MTLAIRIDAIDVITKKAIVVGYALLAVFIEPDSKVQPAKTNVQDVYLNSGTFQLPLYNSLDSGQTDDRDFNAKSNDGHKKLPCSSLLVRLTPAKRSDDGLSVLSVHDFPRSEWESKGIVIPAPKYEERTYDSMQCKPNAMELLLYDLKCQYQEETTVQDALLNVQPEDEGDEESSEWLEKAFKTKPEGRMELSRIARYQPDIGFKVSIDGLHNLSGKKTFYKAIYCLSPPAPFYQVEKNILNFEF